MRRQCTALAVAVMRSSWRSATRALPDPWRERGGDVDLGERGMPLGVLELLPFLDNGIVLKKCGPTKRCWDHH